MLSIESIAMEDFVCILHGIAYVYLLLLTAFIVCTCTHCTHRCCPNGWCYTCGGWNGWAHASDQGAPAPSKPGQNLGTP